MIEFLLFQITGVIHFVFLLGIVLNIAKIEFSVKRLCIAAFFGYLLVIPVSFIVITDMAIFATLSMIVSSILVLKLVFGEQWQRGIFMALIVAFLSTLLESSLTLLLVFLPNFVVAVVMSNLIPLRFIVAVVYGFTFIKTKWVRDTEFSIIDYLNRKYWAAYLFMLILFAQYQSFRVFTFDFYLSLHDTLISLVVIGLSVHNVYYMIKSRDHWKLEKDYKITLEYAEALEKTTDGMREFKHDYSNTLSSIGGYLITDDIDNLKEFMSQLDKEFLANQANAAAIYNFKGYAILGILFALITRAEKNNIEFRITVMADVDLMYLLDTDHAKIFGNLLTNAFDAAEKCERKENRTVEFTVYKGRHTGLFKRCIYVITNGIEDTEIDLVAIFKKGYSTKPEKSGIGLPIVRRVLEKYNERGYNIVVTPEMSGFSFVQRVEF